MTTHIECLNMIKQQLRTCDVLDNNILQLFQDVPREHFVPPSLKEFAYADMQIPLAHGQCMLTPCEEAQLLQALALKGHETILEVGTGSGFLTALLSRLGKHVTSVDYYADFTTAARAKLKQHQCNNTALYTGNAYGGWLEKAPFDVMVFTGGIDEITPSHRLQIISGGKLFALIGQYPVMKGVLYTLDHDENWQSQLVFETYVPPLINPLKPKAFVF